MDRMGGILTKGLGARACNSLIYGPFRLKCFVSKVTTVGAGSAPHGRPGSEFRNSVEDRLKQIHQQTRLQREEDEEVNTDHLTKRRITLTFSFNDKYTEKEYIVDKKRADKIVKAINLINRTSTKMRMSVSNFKKKLHDIKFKVGQ